MKKKKRSNRFQPLARAAEVTLFWLPVFVPLVLLSQLGTKGLRPALSESKRLEQAETQLHEKHALVINRHSELNEGLEASGDIIYRVRLMKRRRQEATLIIESSIQSAGLPVRRR
jgi:hypothetical protein